MPDDTLVHALRCLYATRMFRYSCVLTMLLHWHTSSYKAVTSHLLFSAVIIVAANGAFGILISLLHMRGYDIPRLPELSVLLGCIFPMHTRTGVWIPMIEDEKRDYYLRRSHANLVGRL